MRLPVAAKMALHSAGTTGGRAGSPRPVSCCMSSWRFQTSFTGAPSHPPALVPVRGATLNFTPPIRGKRLRTSRPALLSTCLN